MRSFPKQLTLFTLAMAAGPHTIFHKNDCVVFWSMALHRKASHASHKSVKKLFSRRINQFEMRNDCPRYTDITDDELNATVQGVSSQFPNSRT